jgi:hypothetical protein
MRDKSLNFEAKGLIMFLLCSKVKAQADATGVVSTGRALTKTRPIGRYSRMATQLLAGCELARKCASSANISLNQAAVKIAQVEKLVSAHTLFAASLRENVLSLPIPAKTFVGV